MPTKAHEAAVRIPAKSIQKVFDEWQLFSGGRQRPQRRLCPVNLPQKDFSDLPSPLDRFSEHQGKPAYEWTAAVPGTKLETRRPPLPAGASKSGNSLRSPIGRVPSTGLRILHYTTTY